LRNIALTAPYFHSGKVWDLDVAVEIMAESQLGEALKPEETARLVAFLDSLTGTLPQITVPVLPPETGATPRPTQDIR
jgi:cytochrome c peroxidase